METKTFKRVRVCQDMDPENPRQWCNVATLACWHRRYVLGDEQPDCDPSAYRRHMVDDADATGLLAWLDDSGADTLAEVRAQLRHVIRNVRHGNNSRGFLRDEWAMYRALQSVLATHGTVDDYVDHVLETRYVILPLFLYDHSGITISTGSFGCPWDSGQVGFAYVSRDKAAAEWGGDPDTWADRIRAEVAVYDQYLTGDVYGFEVEQGVPVTITRPDGTTYPDIVWEHEDSCWGFFGYDPVDSGMADHVDAKLHDALKEASHYTNYDEWVYTDADGHVIDNPEEV